MCFDYNIQHSKPVPILQDKVSQNGILADEPNFSIVAVW